MSEIAQTRTFEERMMDRIRGSIGELMSENDLKKIIERGVEKALFEPRDASGRESYKLTKPPLVDECVAKFLSEKMEAAVNAWIVANPEKLTAAVDNALKAGIARCLLDTLDNRFKAVFDELSFKFKSDNHPKF